MFVPKCVKTHLLASGVCKKFPEVIPPDLGPPKRGEEAWANKGGEGEWRGRAEEDGMENKREAMGWEGGTGGERSGRKSRRRKAASNMFCKLYIQLRFLFTSSLPRTTNLSVRIINVSLYLN